MSVELRTLLIQERKQLSPFPLVLWWEFRPHLFNLREIIIYENYTKGKD